MAPRILVLLRVLVGLAGLVPWIASLLNPPALLRFLFRATCHQLPERSLFLAGEQMLVCSRCAGVYAGVFLGSLLPVPKRWFRAARPLLVASFLVVGLDVALQDLGLHPVWHSVRLLTGAQLGWVIAALLSRALIDEGRARRGVAGS
ncbi:MAG TPA: DUF2085 domain-containing protein [Polyangiaceae bacterium]|nr:DUF2085 domain-containing protein [Polyangiaceae bacterium]